MDKQKLNVLKTNLSGDIILPEDSKYDQVKNSLFVKGAPAIVVIPKTAQDVVMAIQFAKDNKLILSIRSGGHSNAGHSTNTGGMIIDLSAINSIEIIDTEKNIVKIGSGAKWIEVAKELQKHDLGISSGDTVSVGVGGLTLGGGIGWIVRKYGLAIDSLVTAEVVTADGKIVRASASENADLFWAIRGGGGNFGVVTYFEFMAHPLKKVFAGTINYGVENIPGILKGWRDAMRTAPEELTTMLLIMPSFGEKMPAGAMVICCYAGDDEAAAMKALEPLTKFGEVKQNTIKQKEYYEVLEEAHPPEGVKIIVKDVFFQTFSDELIDAIVAICNKAIPIMQFRYLGGAMKRVGSDATAFANRDNEVFLVSPTFLPLDANEDKIKMAMEPWEAVTPFVTGSYINFFTDRFTQKDMDLAYPKATYEKLVQVKQKYDPDNLFNQNYNIKP